MKTKKIAILLFTLIILSLTPLNITAAPEGPLLQISAVSFSPEIVSPGKQFNMAVTLTNHGEYNAYNVTLDVLSIAGMPDLNVFSMVGNGNHFYIEEIPTGKSTTIEIPMVSSPMAEARNYNLELKMNCETWGGTAYEFDGIVGIFLNEVDSLSIIVPDDYTLTRDRDLDNPFYFEIANFGSNPVKGVQVSLSSDQIEFQKNYQYYGTFEKDDYDDFSTEISVDQGGTFPVKIALKYRDSFNNERFIEKEIKLLVPEDEVIVKDDEESVGFFQKIIKVIFGIGA